LTTRIGAVVAVVAVVVAVGVAVALGDSKPRQSGSNYVSEAGPVTTVKGTATRCQPGQTVPADTGALRLLVGTYGRQVPILRVTVKSGGRTISSGTLAGGPQRHVSVPIEHVGQRVEGATVCLRVVAPTGTRTVLYGANGLVRLEWLRPGSESWFGLLPTVDHRFGLGRGFFGGAWVLALAALLLAGAWALAVRLTLRELSE
jgi:hypothetical protein